MQNATTLIEINHDYLDSLLVSLDSALSDDHPPANWPILRLSTLFIGMCELETELLTSLRQSRHNNHWVVDTVLEFGLQKLRKIVELACAIRSSVRHQVSQAQATLDPSLADALRQMTCAIREHLSVEGSIVRRMLNTLNEESYATVRLQHRMLPPAD